MEITEYKKAFTTRKNGLRGARALYELYIDRADDLGRLRAGKAELADVLSVTSRTVANYIYSLKSAGLIKRHYDGRTILNPDYYCAGTPENFDMAKRIYSAFAD